MKIVEYFICDRKAHWLEQIKKCEWGAGQYLYQLLSENRFKEAVGEKACGDGAGAGYLYIYKPRRTI